MKYTPQGKPSIRGGEKRGIKWCSCIGDNKYLLLMRD
jgi:hypothetical protein